MFEASHWMKEAIKLLNKEGIKLNSEQYTQLYRTFIECWGTVQTSVLSSMNNIQFQPQPKNGIGYTTELLEVNEEEETE